MDKKFETGQKIVMDDNKEFIVISSVIYNNDNFVYIINLNDESEQYFGLTTLNANNDVDINYLDLDDKENDETINNLVKLFFDDTKKFFDEQIASTGKETE